MTRPTFLGASVLRVNNTLGYGGQGSELRVDLVEDPSNGDSFNPGNINGPVYFTVGGFSFNGVLRKWTRSKSRNGKPVYNVIVSDPRHLLDNCKVITDNYRLAVTGIYNLFNVFGYYENLGYGLSQANSTGMPWQLIRDGLTTLANGSPGTFGGPISYSSSTYGLNLSELPALPSYFRVGGHSAGLSILEFIQICCDAANYDFFVRLVGTTITLKTVARGNEYPLGTLDYVLENTFAGTIVRSEVGLEERNEQTSSFIIGGDVQLLYKEDNISMDAESFWGFEPVGPDETDINNLVPITGGYSGRWANFYAQSNIIYTYPVNEYDIAIDNPSIANITGLTTWFTNDLEMQVLLGLGGQSKNTFTSWVRYLYLVNRTLYLQIALSNNPPDIFQPRVSLPNNIVNTNVDRLNVNQQMRLANLTVEGQWRLHQVYEFLLNYAKGYYGRKFAVYLPNVYRKYDTDSGAISYSHEISDGGWVDATDPNDLSGLPAEAYHRFQTQDARFIGYAEYDATDADISRVNKNTSYQAIDSNTLFNKISLDRQIYFDSSSGAWAILDVDPVYEYPDSIFGLSGVVGALSVATGIYINTTSGVITEFGANVLNRLVSRGQQASIPLAVSPKPRIPTSLQIPIKSNILTYGPWYAQGAIGKIVYQQDPSLVPWNYGGYTNLNLVGASKASDAISQAQIVEAGFIEVAGYPAYNIGDVIVASGTNITNVSVDFGTQGITTTYRFETYVPRPGQLGKYNIDRLRRLSIEGFEINRKIVGRMELLGLTGELNNAAAVGNVRGIQANLPPAIIQQTPQNMLISNVVTIDEGEFSGRKFPITSIAKLDEVVGLIPISGESYNTVATASLESVLVPFTVFDDSAVMPSLLSSDPFNDNYGAGKISRLSDNVSLNPFLPTPSGYGVNYYNKGKDNYKDLNDFNWSLTTFEETLTSGNPGSSSIPKKGIGFKSPVVLTGWGRKLDTELIGQSEDIFDYDVLRNSDKWKCGVLDPLWDEYRNSWTVHDICKAQLDENINHGASGFATLIGDKITGNPQVVIKNILGSQIASGANILIGYNAHDNYWYGLNNPETSSASGLPNGNPYSVLWKDSGGTNRFTGGPTISGIYLGISGVSQENGFVGLGSVSGAGYLKVRAKETGTDYNWYLPVNQPATGSILSASDVNSSRTILTWTTLQDIKTPQTIAYSGSPSFNAPTGYMVFNIYDSSIYVMGSGYTWWKFCPCSGYGFGSGEYSPGSETFLSDGTWIAPAGVTSITIECWGAGGDGADGGGSEGAGGGGGAYSKLNTYSVIPGNSYDVFVAANSTEDTYVINTSVVLAKSGADATGGTGGTGGQSSGGVGDTKYSGADGGVPFSGAAGGGGGAAGSSGDAPITPLAPLGGPSGAPGNGGEGGVGGPSSPSNGSNGNVPGGGGGGGNGTGTGGTGASGKVIITW